MREVFHFSISDRLFHNLDAASGPAQTIDNSPNPPYLPRTSTLDSVRFPQLTEWRQFGAHQD